MSIPAAKLKQIAQGIEDTTTARSNLSNALAKVVANTSSNDPLVMQAATQVLLPDSIRKVTNKLAVAQKAAEHVADEAAAGTADDGASPPDDDWMNQFMRGAEDASSQRLQDLFGRILAGQILHPGAFGVATLRAVSELDQGIASDFVQAWSKSVGGGVDYTLEWKRGDGYMRWRRLIEAGLLADSETDRMLPDFEAVVGELAAWQPMYAENQSIIVLHHEGFPGHWTFIAFTRIGREIGALLEKPNYRENMMQAALSLPKEKVKEIRYHVSGKAPEIVWSAPTPNP
ncbi:DUF2806 domain-containing protein [Oxalobacteraceae sp. CFBP 8761]|nr:DUF2806 domain-containing protein [Oxalobacteraceae sp. CFBP 8761]